MLAGGPGLVPPKQRVLVTRFGVLAGGLGLVPPKHVVEITGRQPAGVERPELVELPELAGLPAERTGAVTHISCFGFMVVVAPFWFWATLMASRRHYQK